MHEWNRTERVHRPQRARLEPWTACLVIVGSCVGGLAAGQGTANGPISTLIDVKPADLLVRPVGSDWPSYNGDYT
ncbi:MAG: hypothetical protein ACRD2O_03080, partial [Terriglobia bacterium]